MHYKITLFAFALSLMGQVGCTPAPEPNGELYGAGFISVRDFSWPVDNDKPYPFTVEYGEIVCGQPHAGIGRQVFFLPENVSFCCDRSASSSFLSCSISASRFDA